jgi:ketosteroid isomerase-like protein
MSARTELVETYFDGFRQQDHAVILDCLTDDVTWYLPGHATLEGKAAFDGEIANPAFEGRPDLRIDRLVEDGDTVVAIGEGQAHFAGGELFRFAYCDAFVFEDDRIRRVESYVVPLTQSPLGPGD